ncbi:hypothetical protein LguiA_034326 [Lonicera macranthoides]
MLLKASNGAMLSFGPFLQLSLGYYNGDIKTRKTVQAIELNDEQLGFQRTEQLRELYESLSSDENNPQPERPSTSLSPEYLTDTEWYFLIARRTLASNQTIWLSNSQYADSKPFSRSLLAKLDKVFVLHGTIEYLKELKRRLNKLESCKKITELEARTRRKPCDVSENLLQLWQRKKRVYNKRKAFDIEEMRTERNQRTLTNSSTNDINLVQSSNINGILSLNTNAKLKGSMMVSTKKIRQSLERLIDVQRL